MKKLIPIIVFVVLLAGCAAHSVSRDDHYMWCKNEIDKAFSSDKKDFTFAIDICRDFIERYPKDKYLHDVYAGLGAAYFFSKKYNDAISVYSELISRFPFSHHCPLSMYRIALSYKQLLDLKSAGEVAKEVIKRYPDSDAAKWILQNIDVWLRTT